MSQLLPTSTHTIVEGSSSQLNGAFTAPTSVESSQYFQKPTPSLPPAPSPNSSDVLEHLQQIVVPNESHETEIELEQQPMKNNQTRVQMSAADIDHMVDVLFEGTPTTPADYAEHLFKVATLFLNGDVSEQQVNKLEMKFVLLADMLPQFVEVDNPAASQLYKVVERCFDVFVKISTGLIKVLVATLTIRFLTTVIMSLNYWELYNLLQWKPAIYQFLTLIHFDLNECYSRFVRDYSKYSYHQSSIARSELHSAAIRKEKNKRDFERRLSMSASPDLDGDTGERSPLYFMNKELSEDHDKFVTEQMAEEPERPIPRERRKIRVDSKLAAHRVIKRADIKVAPSSRSSNYDPDVVHECQMPSPDEPDKMCLRRFSRKYELIRHQETVHSKKKKLFKCFVCVKQDPSIGPRIFTRHDTLAKHIRVNHRISGKEAKAEVAYSKKHAEIVEEGDITVHVGRRKTKVDFELRAHMEKKGSAREAPDGSIIFDDIGDSPPDSTEYGEDDEIDDDE